MKGCIFMNNQLEKFIYENGIIIEENPYENEPADEETEYEC